MKPFSYVEPTTLGDAARQLMAGGSRLIAGGSDLLGELKDGLATYERLVSLRQVPGLREIADEGAGLRIGAGATLTQLQHAARLTGPYRVLAEAARGVATPEIRNRGTLGGNLCQRPRCLHYRSPWIACAKKGSYGCPASESRHQAYLSVFGGGACVAAQASDLAPVLIALGGTAIIASMEGERALPLSGFFVGPEQGAMRENVLGIGEILAAVRLPGMPPDWRGVFLKSRERTAGDFPVVSAAFGCRLDEDRLRDVRLVLGGVAPIPRLCPEAEARLEGQRFSPEAVAAAAEAAFANAIPLASNAYKLDLGRALVQRAIAERMRPA